MSIARSWQRGVVLIFAMALVVLGLVVPNSLPSAFAAEGNSSESNLPELDQRAPISIRDGGDGNRTKSAPLVGPSENKPDGIELFKVRMKQPGGGYSWTAGYCLNADLAGPSNADYATPGPKQTTSGAFASYGISNPQQVQWILENGYAGKNNAVHYNTPRTQVLLNKAGVRPNQISHQDLLHATQLAIWRYTNGYTVQSWWWNYHREMKKVYDYLVTNAASGAKLPDYGVSITPSVQQGNAGQKIGPFTVKTTGGNATLTMDAPSGVTLVDENGNNVNGSRVYGSKNVYVQVPAGQAPGRATLILSGKGELPTGAFLGEDSKTRQPVGTVNPGGVVYQTVNAVAVWIEKPVTSTEVTTSTETTTVTEPSTVTETKTVTPEPSTKTVTPEPSTTTVTEPTTATSVITVTETPKPSTETVTPEPTTKTVTETANPSTSTATTTITEPSTSIKTTTVTQPPTTSVVTGTPVTETKTVTATPETTTVVVPPTTATVTATPSTKTTTTTTSTTATETQPPKTTTVTVTPVTTTVIVPPVTSTVTVPPKTTVVTGTPVTEITTVTEPSTPTETTPSTTVTTPTETTPSTTVTTPTETTPSTTVTTPTETTSTTPTVTESTTPTVTETTTPTVTETTSVPAPTPVEVRTVAVDQADNDKTVVPGGTIVDSVSLKGLTEGETYTLVGELMDKETGKPIGATAMKTFVAAGTSGTVQVTFELPSKIDAKKLVVFEKLYAGTNVNAQPIASHEDINDEAQTVAVEEVEDKGENPGGSSGALGSSDGNANGGNTNGGSAGAITSGSSGNANGEGNGNGGSLGGITSGSSGNANGGANGEGNGEGNGNGGSLGGITSGSSGNAEGGANGAGGSLASLTGGGSSWMWLALIPVIAVLGIGGFAAASASGHFGINFFANSFLRGFGVIR